MKWMSPEAPEGYGPAGAVPPTEGVAPENAPPVRPEGESQRSAADDLADGLDLLLRAARKAAGTVDPRIERAAEQALERLQALDAGMTREFARRTSAFAPRLEQVARETGKEIADLVKRLSERIETNVKL
jgi:hypothetical protein